MNAAFVSIALPIVLLLSGCSTTTPIEETASPSGARDGPTPAARWFNQSFQLDLTEARYPLGNSGGPKKAGNCVWIESPSEFQILEGTAELVWTANTPLTEELTLHLRTFDPYQREIHGPARSPLKVSWDAFRPALVDSSSGTASYSIDVHAEDPGAAAAQEVKLTLAFAYATNSSIRNYVYSCA